MERNYQDITYMHCCHGNNSGGKRIEATASITRAQRQPVLGGKMLNLMYLKEKQGHRTDRVQCMDAVYCCNNW